MGDRAKRGSAMPVSAGGKKLDAVNLKDVLWETLNKVKSGKITPAQGDVIGGQAREILRTVKTQLMIFSQAGQGVTEELCDFAAPAKRRRMR